MRDWQEHYKSNLTSADEAILKGLRSGNHIVLQGGCGEPQTLVEALVRQRAHFEGLVLYTEILASPVDYVKPEMAGHVALHSFMMAGARTREAIRAGHADYIPCNLSEIARLFTDGYLPVDAALVQLSPPDRHGYCSLGVMADFTKPAAEIAQVIIAEINERMPRTHGNCFLHVSQLDYIVESSRPLLEVPSPPIGEVEKAIGQWVAELVPDGATIQFGIGAIPDASLHALTQKRELGVHSGMLTDSIVHLFEAGAITNQRKTFMPGRMVTTAIVGTAGGIYRFVDDNPLVELHPATLTHNILNLAKIDNFVSINSALQVDLSGQVNGETLGGIQMAGLGGQMDFVRGASLSKNGRSIIALPATAGGGKTSRIVAQLEAGSAVTTPRADVHYVVTEYGVAELRGKTVRQRAQALAAIAHPDFRAELRRAAEKA